MKEWPKRSIKVPEYDCTIEFYDPTIAELNAIEEARKANDNAKLKELMMGLVTRWDAIDRAGKEIPIGSTGLDQLPPVFMGALVDGMVANISPKASDPKGSACESSLIMQPEPEGKKSETPLLKQ